MYSLCNFGTYFCQQLVVGCSTDKAVSLVLQYLDFGEHLVSFLLGHDTAVFVF